MATPNRRAPRFMAIHSADLDRKKRDVIIRLISDEGQRYTMNVNEAVIAPLVLALLSQKNKLSRDPSGADMQPVTLTGVLKFAIPDGRSGLELRFDFGLTLPTLLPPKAVAVLRNELAKLEEIGKPPDPSTLPH